MSTGKIMNPIRDYKNKNKPRGEKISNGANNKILLSIAILAWNRAPYLKNLLNNILPQARELKEKVEICVSNNNSTDNTREVVMKFKEKYPDLIKYNENKENLGFDKNFLKATEMSNGDFVWTFGHDDNIVENGLSEVVKFLKRIPEDNIGLIVVKRESYLIDKQTGKKIIYENTLDKNQPETFKIDKKDIIGLSFPDIVFISALIFNNKLLKKIFREDRAIIEKGIGTEYIQILLYSLMFSKYPYIKGIAFNKIIVSQELTRCKYSIEDRFKLHYLSRKKINSLLLSSGYVDLNIDRMLTKWDRKKRRGFIFDMVSMRAFQSFDYSSYSGCLKKFFSQTTLWDALIFSFFFLTFSITPAFFFKNALKIYFKIKYGKNWKSPWLLFKVVSSETAQDVRRSVGPIEKD